MSENSLMVVVVLAVIAVIFIHRNADGSFALGVPPAYGGADGSPEAQAAGLGPQSSGGTPGNSEQNIAHGLESLGGGIVGAAACTYYGAAALAPACAKVGSILGPKAVAFGNKTITTGTDFGAKTTNIAAQAGSTFVAGHSAIAGKVANIADTAYAGTSALGGGPVVQTVAKASLLPIKVGADVGAKVAGVATSGAKKIEGGVKAATSAVSSGAKKILGFL
jgi:hypothetical protein